MINRRALWISLLVLFAMIAADVWRLSLLPDWHHIPAEGPGNSHTVPVLAFFTPVLAVLFTMAVLFSRKWLRSGPEEAMQPWRRWYGLMLLFNTAIAASAQAFNLARSMGALQSINRIALSHGIMVVGGIFMILVGNMLPKMPWLLARFRPLDQWQWNRHLRFGGKVTVIFGVFIALILPLLPVKMVLPATLGLALAVTAVNYWHRAKVRREPSPQP
jgi:uncharacterized membrane protein